MKKYLGSYKKHELTPEYMYILGLVCPLEALTICCTNSPSMGPKNNMNNIIQRSLQKHLNRQTKNIPKAIAMLCTFHVIQHCRPHCGN